MNIHGDWSCCRETLLLLLLPLQLMQQLLLLLRRVELRVASVDVTARHVDGGREEALMTNCSAPRGSTTVSARW